MRFEYTGLLGLLILIADVWAIMNVVGSNSTPGKKAVWVVLVLILPVLGFLIWLMAGPRAHKS